MRGFIISLALVFMGATVTSCTTSQEPAKSGSPAAAASDAKPGVVMSDGKAVLTMTLPTGTQTFNEDNKFTAAEGKWQFHFYVWMVKDAKTLDDAAARVPELIKSEFLEFKLVSKKDLIVAGSPAKQLDGSGKEADDHDPGNAEVVLFTVGGKVFAACIHGEGNAPDVRRSFMMTAIQTAKAP